MSKDLIVRLDIPFFPDRDPIIFHKWFPLNRDNEIIVDHGDVSVRLWFDEDCLLHADRDMEQIKKLVNVMAAKMHAQVIIHDVPDEIAKFIYQEKAHL